MEQHEISGRVAITTGNGGLRKINVTTDFSTAEIYLHGAHVTIGIIWLLLLWGRSMQGRLPAEKAEAVEIAGLYWHFVDVVWIFIFTAIYLIPTH